VRATVSSGAEARLPVGEDRRHSANRDASVPPGDWRAAVLELAEQVRGRPDWTEAG